MTERINRYGNGDGIFTEAADTAGVKGAASGQCTDCSYQDEEGCNEQTEDGRDYVREVEFFRVIAVIHEAHESRGTGLTLCPTVILEKVKGDEARFLADCTYDKDIYFVDPKNFK